MGVEIVEGVKIVERLERFVLREIIMKIKNILGNYPLCFALAAMFVLNGYSKPKPAAEAKADARKYLVFELTNIRLRDTVCGYDEAVHHLVSELGTNHPSSDRMYAFGLNGMPLLTRSVAVLNDQVNLVFDIAEKHDVPVYFHIDPVYSIGMENSPDGEEPALRFWEHPGMCEWVNFPAEGQTSGQIPRCWVNWGNWVKLSNAMPNYESPELKRFYKSQLEDGVLKPIKERLSVLEQEGKGYLFAGLNIGWETRFQDKSDLVGQAITNTANASEIMQEWEQAKTGYAALHTKGWDDARLTRVAKERGVSNDRLFYDLCAESVHDNMEMLAKIACEYGFSKSRIFSHIVAIESCDEGSRSGTNVESPPVWTALNDYCTPGFTLDKRGAAVYDLDEMRKVFKARGHEFKYGAVETYLFHYQTGAEYTAQRNEFFDNGTTLISVLGAVYAPYYASHSPFEMNKDQAAAIRNWLNP